MLFCAKGMGREALREDAVAAERIMYTLGRRAGMERRRVLGWRVTAGRLHMPVRHAAAERLNVPMRRVAVDQSYVLVRRVEMERQSVPGRRVAVRLVRRVRKEQLCVLGGGAAHLGGWATCRCGWVVRWDRR